MKLVKSVIPYIYEGKINFKHKPYNSWVALGGQVAKSHYPWRFLHKFAFDYDFHTLGQCKNEARLRFVQPWSLYFDTFPDYIFYEIIPFIWDCWPENFEKVFTWLRVHNVKTAIFTSSQFADMVRERFPNMNVLWCPEGIDIDKYQDGNELKKRKIDFLEYGRNIDGVVKYSIDNLKILRGQKNGVNCLTDKELNNAMQDARIVAAYPKAWTNPELAGGIETLTQRYWECMLSRMVMIGHAPMELINFVGYNPVIEVDLDNPNKQLQDVLSHIEDYQELVDKNRETALQLGSWDLRIKDVMNYLRECGYEC